MRQHDGFEECPGWFQNGLVGYWNANYSINTSQIVMILGVSDTEIQYLYYI